MTQTKNRHTKIKMLGILSVAFVVVCGTYIFNHSYIASVLVVDSNTETRMNPHSEYSNFKAGTKISRAILAKDVEISKDIKITSDNSTIVGSSDPFKGAEQYNLVFQIIEPNDSYVDVTFDVNQQKIKTDISGLERSDKVSFKLNKEYFMKEVPVDWSGKTSFAVPMTDRENKKRFCLEILNDDQSIKSICHTILEGEVT